MKLTVQHITLLFSLTAAEDLPVCGVIRLESGQWFQTVPRPAQRTSLPPPQHRCCVLIPRKTAVERLNFGQNQPGLFPSASCLTYHSLNHLLNED